MQRAAAVLAMLVMSLAVAGVTAVPAAAATTYEVTATIGVGSDPVRVGVDPATDTVYVANAQSNSVSVIDGATNTVTATIGVGSSPFGVGVDPATDTVYVANDGSGTVSVIDGATNTVTATIGVGSHPYGVGVDPAMDTVYVANSADTLGSTVSVIDGATNTVTATIAVGSGPEGVGVDPATHTVYVTNTLGSTVSVIDGATNTVTATIGVAANPIEVGVDSSTHTAYVVNEGSDSVSVIDGATNTVTATIKMGSEPFGVDVDSAARTIYVGTRQNNSVSVIDGATNTVTAAVGVGSDPAGLGVDPATHNVYVTNDSSDNVSVITPPQPGPASVTATPRNTAAAVSWTAPAYLVNRATVTGYTATASPGGETCSTTEPTSCTITGLTNDTTYSIAVIAHTTAGDSAAQTEGVSVVPWGATCPCTLWPSTAQPAVTSANETSPVNLGVQFTPAADGQITGIRFYKGPGNTGTHTGELWTASGTLLGKVTFTGESASGWQEADFSSPIAVSAGTTYAASYFAPNGGYSYTTSGFASAGVANGPLTAPQSSAVTGGNGVYSYSGSPSFPASTYRANNYWVDVVFTRADSAPMVTGSTPDSGSRGNPVTTAPTVTFSQPVVPSTVSFTVKDPGGDSVAAAVSFNADDTVATFTPTNSLAGGTTYTVTVSGAQTPSGTAMASPYSWTFTTAGSQCPCSLWPLTATPSVASANDPSAVNLGVQFTTSADGWISGIRFYKGPGNTGTHTGELWTASGTLLGKVTFTGESASGWQEADFSSPIAVTAGTTYVASYFAPNGGYAYDGGYFAKTGLTSGPLTAPQSSIVSGGNGVYNYGSSPSFPDATYNAANYWVDVMFTQT